MDRLRNCETARPIRLQHPDSWCEPHHVLFLIVRACVKISEAVKVISCLRELLPNNEFSGRLSLDGFLMQTPACSACSLCPLNSLAHFPWRSHVTLPEAVKQGMFKLGCPYSNGLSASSETSKKETLDGL